MMTESKPPHSSDLTQSASQVVTAHEAMVNARRARALAHRQEREARQLALQREIQIAEGVIAHNSQVQSASG